MLNYEKKSLIAELLAGAAKLTGVAVVIRNIGRFNHSFRSLFTHTGYCAANIVVTEILEIYSKELTNESKEIFKLEHSLALLKYKSALYIKESISTLPTI